MSRNAQTGAKQRGMQMNDSPKTNETSDGLAATGFINGLNTGAPISIGYLPSAIACGILANSAGLTLTEAAFMSLIVFAGASQFAALNLLMNGAVFPEIILAAAVLNARLIMFSSSISRRLLPGTGAVKKAWIGFELTDESFSIASAQKERFFAPEFMIGLNTPGHFAWVVGTVMGFLGASVLPDAIQKSMGIAIYALLIGLLTPMVRTNRPGLTVTALAMALSAFFKWTPYFKELNVGVILMLATAAAALFGACLLRRRATAR